MVKLKKENNNVEYTSFRNEIIETIEKTEATNMSERKNLTKLKIKKSQEKYLNFAKLVIQKFFDDIELVMNDVNAMSYVCAKTVDPKLGVKPKKTRKSNKMRNQSGKMILKRKLKR